MIDARNSREVPKSSLNAHGSSECFKLRTCFAGACPARHCPAVAWICCECAVALEEVEHALPPLKGTSRP